MLCIECGEAPITAKKWKMCARCNQRRYAAAQKAERARVRELLGLKGLQARHREGTVVRNLQKDEGTKANKGVSLIEVPQSTLAVTPPSLSAGALPPVAEFQRKVGVDYPPRYLSEGWEEAPKSSFEAGSRLLGLNPTAYSYKIAGVLEARRPGSDAPRYRRVVGMVPRRAGKTTTIWSVLLGRCLTIPGYQVAATAQDGTRARETLKDIARLLVAQGFEDSGLGVIRWANGSEAVEFENGSRIWAIPPREGAFRGRAADCLLFDEAGEYDVATSRSLLQGALPLMDTRPMGQAIIVGTPAKLRAGLLWDTLQAAHAGKRGLGIFEWSMGDEEELVEEVDGVQVLREDVMRRVHPGIDVLTPWDVILDRFEEMALPDFEREYACRFPFDNSVSAVDQQQWRDAAAQREDLPAEVRENGRLRGRFALAYAVEPDGSEAALVAAWRDEHGVSRIALVDHRQGTGWLATMTRQVALKYSVPVRYDSIGAQIATADELARAGRVRLARGGQKETYAAAQRLVQDLADGRLRHFNQKSLNAAVAGAAWRQTDQGRAFSYKASASAICPLVAASLALWEFDTSMGGTRRAGTLFMSTVS